MNFSLNAKLSRVTKQSWSVLTTNLWRIHDHFCNGYFPELNEEECRIQLTVKRNLLPDSKPFYEIIIDREIDRILIQSLYVNSTVLTEHNLIGCLPSSDFAIILNMCNVEGYKYNLLTPDISLYLECNHKEHPVFNMAVYGTEEYLSELWEADRLKHASDLAYEIFMHPYSSFKEFINSREVKNVKIGKYLPILEAKNPGLTDELKDWHARITDSKLLDQQRYMRYKLMELCYLSSKPLILDLLGVEWVERELQRAVDIAESNGFQITRGVIPVEDFAIRFDKLLEERKKWVAEQDSNRNLAMDSN